MQNNVFSPLIIVFMIVSMSVLPITMLPNLVLVASSSPSAPSTISQSGDFTAQAPLQIPRTLQSTDLVNSLAFYEVTFITSTTGAIDKIRMDFPAGTGVGAAGIIERIGIGGGTLLKSGSSITYDLTTPVSIPAGTFIRLEMFGIKNPVTPSTAFTAMITTRDNGGNLIDGPSPTNVYTIKRIGSSDLADGSVTSTKPNANFMNRVTVADTPAGHAVGWNPDGIMVNFIIFEPLVETLNSVFFIIEVESSVFQNHFCDVISHSDVVPAVFSIRCSSAPSDGSTLHYVVGNLPEHVIS
jgi:hypothetical protein